MGNTTTSNNSGLKWSYFQRKVLDLATPMLVLDPIGDKKPLPQQYGSTVTFVKFKKLTAVTATGTEGTAPTLLALTSVALTSAVSQYKNGIGYTDAILSQASIDEVLDNMSEVVAQNAAESVDTICRDSLVSALSDNIIYGGGAAALSDVDAADKLTLSLVRQQKATFEANNVGPHKSGSYIFVGHPNTLYDMKTDTADAGWIDVFKYSDAGHKKLFNAEAGTVDDIKFLSTTLVSKTNSGTSASAYAYTNLMFGYQPFGSIVLDGYSTKLIHHKPGSSGVADPTNELGSISWKIWYAAMYFGGNSTVSDPHRGCLIKTGRAS
jgi:N4-gp56 family major capsid protein